MSNFNNKLSLYIPRITPEWASEEAIKDQFNFQNIGLVERVDLIHKTLAENGSEYYQAFIHFHEWYDNSATRNIQERINTQDPEHPARLVYDDPWYWILLRNTNPRSEAERRMEGRIRTLELAMQERVLVFNDFQNNMGCVVEDLENRLYDLELEYQAMMHSDAAREEVDDDATVPPPSWASPIRTNLDTTDQDSMDRPFGCQDSAAPPIKEPQPQRFNTVDDDREIAKWEEKQQQRLSHVVHLPLATKHGGRDDWCDP